jgi:hypothetical protein
VARNDEKSVLTLFLKAVETTDEVNVVEWREMMKKAF